MKARFVTSILVVAVLASQARSQAPGTFLGLYRQRCEITLPEDGLVRLPLSAEVIASGGAELSNVRLVDRFGTEIPFAIDPSPPEPSREVRVGPLVPIDATQETSGDVPPVHSERFDLAIPDAPPPGTPWELALIIDRPSFTASIEVMSISGDEATEIMRRTVFRLESGIERTRFALDVQPGSHLRVALRGQDGFLTPRFELVSTIAPTTPVVLRFPLSIAAMSRDGASTSVQVDLPGGLHPSRLEIDSSTPSFARPVTVRSRANGELVEIGAARIERTTGISAVERRILTLDDFGDSRLQIRIDDGSSPPLGDIEVVALVDQPSLVFDTNGAYARSDALALLFGGARIERRPYAEESTLLARETKRLALATLGRPTPNPAYSDAPALAFAMRAGAEVDPRAFRFRAPLDVPRGVDGLTRVELPVEVLASAADGLTDLRVVDSRNRQWPYLIAADDRIARAFDVTARRVRAGGPRKSVYEIVLPRAGLEATSLRVEPRTPLVDRPILVEDVSDPDTAHALVVARLVRRPGDTSPIVIPLGAGRVRKLRITIDDGDEAPLDARFALDVPRPTLLLAAAPGRYRLFVGAHRRSAEYRRPSYDLENAREFVTSVTPVDARVGRLAENPENEPPSPFSRERWHDLVLWSVLVIATLALFGLTLRLVRTEATS